MYLSISNLTPVAFHGYTSVTLDDVLSTDWEDSSLAKAYREQCLAMFPEAYDDNKIVFEFKTKYGQKPIFIGFYDGRMTIGLACRTNKDKVIGL